MKQKILKFFGCRDGSIAPIVFVTISVVLLATGVAIDYSTALHEDSEVQDALDAAILASVHGSNNREMKSILRKHFYSKKPGARLSRIRISNGPTGKTITATATSAADTSVMALTGKKTTKVNALSQVVLPSKKVSEVMIRTIYAKGWYSKKAKLMVRANGSNKDVPVITATYTYSGYGDNGRFTVSPSRWVSLGNYQYVYLLMEIDPYSRGWGRRWKNTFRSDNPKYSDRFMVNGRRQPANTKIDLLTLAPCGQTIKLAWEDGGGFPADIFFELKTKCGEYDTNIVRLTR